MSILVRKQFSFLIHEKKFSQLLNLLADNSINITGLQLNYDCHNRYDVNMVVGLSESTEFDKEYNRQLKKYLKNLGVRYKKNKIIQVISFVSGTPGVFRNIYNMLYKKVKILNSYLGENNKRFLYVNNTKKAIKILTEN
ncbi:hypothetical protein Catovirus_1_243 [Catovirus CTV1]|uniref:Uncharacterized protein n=1 Tax=Catovirus CTV1 TaxID=1977631 RepID=A0A1V0S906_9VIRU|nr:hypothetical protein Catovirus_1_243 [Catovirus CTV1]